MQSRFASFMSDDEDDNDNDNAGGLGVNNNNNKQPTPFSNEYFGDSSSDNIHPYYGKTTTSRSATKTAAAETNNYPYPSQLATSYLPMAPVRPRPPPPPTNGFGSAVGAGTRSDTERIVEKLNYLILLQEEKKAENGRTETVTEEFILYSFLGMFMIFVCDAFARSGC